MKILLVSSFLPYPLFSGGHIRLFNIIKNLSKKHQITLVCERRDCQTDNDIKHVEEFCDRIIVFDRKKQWTFQNILKTGFSSNAFLITGHTNKDMKLKIKELLDHEKFDLIHVETFYVYQNLPKTLIPIMLVEHNIEYLVYKRFADNAPLFMKLFLYFDVFKLKLAEERCWKKAKKLVAVSEQEKKLMARNDVVIIPNGVDIDKFKMVNSEEKLETLEKRILFIGDFKWLENRDAVRFILEKIWTELNGKLLLWIVGKNIPPEIRKLGGDNVIFDENAPSDTALIYEKASILLAPIRIGGGTSFKILESMASGVPVITTPLGNEGIEAKDREEILLANTPSDFVKNIDSILREDKFYIKLAQNARRFIEKKFDWQNIVGKLEEVYKSAVS